MSDASTPPPPTPPSPPTPPQNSGDPQPVQFAHHPTSARIPEKVGRGVIATGFLAYFGPHEFVIDFLQLMSRPTYLAARVVMAPVVVEQFIGVLRENLARYAQSFGQPQALPKAPADQPQRAPQEIYDDLKISDDILSGVYANNVLVGHTPAEFGIDFITSFIPHAAVSARVYISAPRVPQLVETLNGLLMQYKRQHATLTPGPVRSGPKPPENYGTAPGIPGFPTPPGA